MIDDTHHQKRTSAEASNFETTFLGILHVLGRLQYTLFVYHVLKWSDQIIMSIDVDMP